MGQQIEEQADFEKMYKNGGLSLTTVTSVVSFEQITWHVNNDLFPLFIFLFPVCSRAAWADNADACAKQYAGTGALKTDFTRSVFIQQTLNVQLNTW